MNELSQLTNAVIIISLTGTISYLLWKRLMPFMEKNVSRLIYFTLCQTCLFSLLPVGFLMVMFFRRRRYIQGDDWWRMDFRVTGTMGVIVLLLWAVWLFRAIGSAGKSAKNRLMQWGKRWVSIPEEDEEALAEFYAAKKELKIHRFVGLRRDERVQSPMITGTIFARVLLPFLDSYTREQFRVICYHELTHCRKNDVFFRFCSVIIGPPHILRFLGEERRDMLEEWSERHCDVCAIRALRGKLTSREYFGRILDMVEQKARQGESGDTACALFDDPSRLGRRIEYVANFAKTNRMSKGMAALFLISFFMVNLSSAYTIGNLLADFSDMAYRATERVNIRANKDDLEEIFLAGSEDATYKEIAYSEHSELSSSVENRLEGETLKLSTDIRYTFNRVILKKGRNVRISCMTSSKTEKVWIGLMSGQSGDIQYVEGLKNLGHTFMAPENGEYDIFVQNCGSREMEVTVSYYCY